MGKIAEKAFPYLTFDPQTNLLSVSGFKGSHNKNGFYCQKLS